MILNTGRYDIITCASTSTERDAGIALIPGRLRKLVRVAKSLIRFLRLTGSGVEADLPIRWVEVHGNQGTLPLCHLIGPNVTAP